MKQGRAAMRTLLVAVLALIALAALLSQAALAGTSLPPALQRIQEYNLQLAGEMLLKISFFVAFLAGALTLLSPCILPLLPAYFSCTFREKRRVTAMTLLFFLGFALVFMSFGFVAGLVGERSLSSLQRPWLVAAAGLFLIAMGLLAFFDRGFASLLRAQGKRRSDPLGVFLSGTLFALGWTACVGPILSGILMVGALLVGKAALASLMMLFYSLGIFVPLFVLSMTYDRLNLRERGFLKGKECTIPLLGRRFRTNTWSMLSGSLLMLLGAVFIAFKGTGVVNRLGWSPELFDAAQRWLLGWQYADVAGMLLMAAFAGLLVLFLVKRKSRE